MTITATDHLVILVKDIDSAIENWQALGCKLTHRAHIESVSIDQAFFSLEDGSFLELIAPSQHSSPLTRALEVNGEGIHTVALKVNDLNASVTAMQQNGVAVSGVGTDQVFVQPKSANGVRIQLWDKQRPHRWKANPSEDQDDNSDNS